MADFELHERLAADTAFIADWKLSRVLLMNDARYPWIILVPRKFGLREMHDLSVGDETVLMKEITRASLALETITNAHKINIGALGNIVQQLHIHIVARNPGDPAWPGPVWGNGTAQPYDPAVLKERAEHMRNWL